MTAHSPVGLHPAEYSCRVTESPFGGFARNDVQFEALSGCDLVALESNYDLHMLRSGPTPTICAPASRACGDTFPTTSAPQSFWN